MLLFGFPAVWKLSMITIIIFMRKQRIIGSLLFFLEEILSILTIGDSKKQNFIKKNLILIREKMDSKILFTSSKI